MTAIAKTDRKTGARRSLIGHSLDIALAAARLLAAPVLRSRLETTCGHRLTEVQLARLTCLAGLHDCGKALVGFQANISVALAQVRTQVAATSAYDPIAEMDELAAELLRRFPTALGEAAPIQWTCSLDHLFAGLTMLADWLGSSLPVAGDDWRPSRRCLTRCPGPVGTRGRPRSTGASRGWRAPIRPRSRAGWCGHWPGISARTASHGQSPACPTRTSGSRPGPGPSPAPSG
ncbi:HD domain-containing protein [Candidatus Thiodictyon syntrophicum]|uniref:HD Cas3-type domain-containing protein n=1 Tax=Candidatus Thiodictyon syntrophicum TaxID=1166950 RepID=A0A2K8U8T8_9GAMM|nr:HD domain-containing protein [Candidatus Thiodictyon syntrophicum]AUB82002.1 hypothetical protein THSYN_14340 [Candidatus Thiodictyon syntrophicum]